MIISKTPMRISFVGGGTDLKAFYSRYTGSVISTAIDKHIYICIHKHYDGKKFLLKYSEIEEGRDVDNIKNNLIRESMKLTGVNGVEIVSMSDIPATGTGLGSSSSFTVGLLNALYAYKGVYKTAEELAKDACKIEIEIIGKPIGKQDQYIAAYGGIKQISFFSDEKVLVENISINMNQAKALNSNLLLFYTGISRSADTILKKQNNNTINKIKSLIKMKNLTDDMKKCLANFELDKIGELLHKNWLEKRKLAQGISDPKIDELYKKAIRAGATGGKITGAGGGGHLLFYCKQEKQNKVREALKDIREIPFSFEQAGSRIIYNNE